MSRARSVAGGLAVIVAGTALVGCGGSSSSKAGPTGPAAARRTAPVTAAGLLASGKRTLDAAPSVHFVVTSTGIAGSSGTSLTGGSGDVVRPSALKGSFSISLAGFTQSVDVVAAGGKFYVQLPFTSHYSATNPATYGLPNPAGLLDPNTGLSTLLTRATATRLVGQERAGSEVLDQVTGTVAGTAIPVLPDAHPSRPVTLDAGIDPVTRQLRTVTLTGPFTSNGTASYTVVLSAYGEHVTIAAPTT